MGQKSGHDWLGPLTPGSSQAATEVLAGLVVLPRLYWGRKHFPDLVHGCCQDSVLGVVGLRASVLHWLLPEEVTLSSLLPGSFHKAAQNMAADFIQAWRARGYGSKIKNMAFCHLISSCCTLFIRSESLSPVLTWGRGLHKGVTNRKPSSLGAYLMW